MEWFGCAGSLDAEELGERKVRRDLLAVVEADAARVQPILTLVAADHPLAVIVTSATDALDRRVIFGRDLLRVDAVADRLVYHRLAAFRTAKRGTRSRCIADEGSEGSETHLAAARSTSSRSSSRALPEPRSRIERALKLDSGG